MPRVADNTDPLELNPGEWCWRGDDDNRRFTLCTPNGITTYLPIVVGDIDAPAYPGQWIWDGDKDAPTIRPSMDIDMGNVKWHGFITNGEFVEVKD